MISTIIGVIQAGLELWSHKEKNKYRDKLIRLKRDFYREYNKTPRDMSKLDHIEHELRILGESFTTAVIGTKDSSDS